MNGERYRIYDVHPMIIIHPDRSFSPGVATCLEASDILYLLP